MVSHDLTQFSGHRHCGSRDIMFLVVEGQDYTCTRFKAPLLFISKPHCMPWSQKKFQDVDIIVSWCVQ